MKYSRYNVVIVGTGLAGLYLANKLSEDKNFHDDILIITKEDVFSGSTSLAQGGIVSVIPEINKKDSIEAHIKDTLNAGCGLNNLNCVELVSKYSSTVAQELIHFGVEFDKNENNLLNFTLEAAHSCPRILHAKGDSTGRIIEEALTKKIIEKSNVEIYRNTIASELLVDENKTARGLVTYNWLDDTYEAIYSNCIVLATGGIGQIYEKTTNPETSTGDGIALAYKAGADIDNMEFVQFHPSALAVQKQTCPLVSESVRGEGGKVVDLNGEYFTKNYHHLGDLAPRDVVARAIYQQMKLTNTDHVNIDISQIGIEKFKKRFPTITSLCEENNIDISNGLIPVTPCQHYFMGGIKTDLEAKTTIKNLFAIGECANTGLHGANRLASNSLLECGVFAHILSQNIEQETKEPPKKFDAKIKETIDKYLDKNSLSEEEKEKIEILDRRLRKTMTQNVGISRTKEGLKKALEELEEIEYEFSKINSKNSRYYFELENKIICAKQIATFAQNRFKSIGANFRADYKEKEIEETTLRKERVNLNEQILAK